MASDDKASKPDLGEIRERIDDIDARIQSLLREPGAFVQE